MDHAVIESYVCLNMCICLDLFDCLVSSGLYTIGVAVKTERHAGDIHRTSSTEGGIPDINSNSVFLFVSCITKSGMNARIK